VGSAAKGKSINIFYRFTAQRPEVRSRAGQAKYLAAGTHKNK